MMKDFSTYQVTVKCPSCNGELKESISNIASEQKAKCSCGHIFRLEDPDGKYKQVLLDLNVKASKIFR